MDEIFACTVCQYVCASRCCKLFVWRQRTEQSRASPYAHLMGNYVLKTEKIFLSYFCYK